MYQLSERVNRRTFLAASIGATTTASIPVHASNATSVKELGAARNGDEPSNFVLIKDDGQYLYYKTEFRGSAYLMVFSYEGELVYVDEISEQNFVTGTEIQTAERRHESASQGVTAQSVEPQAYDGPDIIERSDAYQRQIGTCTDGCGAHNMEGISIQFNKYVAGVSKAVIAAAILKEIAAVAAGTILARALSSNSVKVALGKVGTIASGNTITFAFTDFDLNYVFGTKKLTNGGAGLTSWKPGPNQILTYITQSGHLYGCP